MRALGLLLAALVLVAGGWTALWFYAAGEAEHGFDRWIADEAASGRHWLCPDRTVAGYPLALEISCAHPSFAGLALGQQARGSVANARITVALTDPRRATLFLAAPLVYRTEDGAVDVTAAWSGMSVDLEGLPTQVTRGTLAATDVTAQGRAGTADRLNQQARTLNAALADVSGAADPTVDFSLAISGAAVPLLDQILGGTQLVDAVASGRLTQAIFAEDDTPAALVERWRQRGGSITFSSARLSRESSRVEASGALHLDGAHRVEGRLDAGFFGAEPILRRYGINPNLVAAGSILNSLFGRKDAAPPSDGRPAIRLPVVFRNGRLGIGPVTTSIGLPALY